MHHYRIMESKAYVARMVYRICCKGIFEEQYEEQWRLILAKDDRTALAEARRLAAADEDVFTDMNGRSIQWQLVAVKDLQEVSLTHGSLLASVVKEVEPLAEPIWAA